MAVADKFTVRMVNTNVVATNYEQFGIECRIATAGATVAQAAAQILAYVGSIAATTFAGGTTVQAIYHVPAGTVMANLVPFPVANYANLKTLNPTLPTQAAYGAVFGGVANLTPIGTSGVMSEYTLTPGPSGRGRHYLPFIASSAVAVTGTWVTAQRTAVQTNYIDYLSLTNAARGTIALDPVVLNAAGTTAKQITTIVAQPIFSNLRSRRT